MHMKMMVTTKKIESGIRLKLRLRKKIKIKIQIYININMSPKSMRKTTNSKMPPSC